MNLVHRSSPLVIPGRLENTRMHKHHNKREMSLRKGSLVLYAKLKLMNKHSHRFCIFSFKKPSPKVLPFHLLNIISQPLKKMLSTISLHSMSSMFSQSQSTGLKRYCCHCLPLVFVQLSSHQDTRR